MKSAMKTKADELAAKWNGSIYPDFDDLRDWVDTKTGGELDALQVDILTDMVAQRLSGAKRDV